MAHEKKGAKRKNSARMRRLREMRRKKTEEEQATKTREQIAILLSDWSQRGIVRQESP